MTSSSSTPRVRLMTFAVLAAIVATAVSRRCWADGTFAVVAAYAGFTLVVIAALGRLWVSLFIAGSKDETLVRTGPYAACRHPLYALSLVGMLGLGLATRSLSIACVLVGIAVLLHTRAMRAEDRRLEALHGEAARRYRAEVPALWPAWDRHEMPATLEIRPRLVWKAVLDAGSLLLAFALVEAAHRAQQAGLTPAWLGLP